MRALNLRPLAFAVLAITFIGCSHVKTRTDVRREQREAIARRAIASVSTAVAESKSISAEADDMRLDEDSTETIDSVASQEGIKLVPGPESDTASEENASDALHTGLNPEIQKWIQYFTVKDRERFQRFLNRGDQYREAIEATLKASGLPSDFYYLAMIESGYRTDAYSTAKAVGVWQFIPGTADRYGLRVDRYVDERRDPIRATQAAAKYLKDLYNVFGSWHLAMSAYNAGEIRVLRAVFKGNSRDFWTLARKKALPRETADYVPKFLAVVHIGENPTKYGFTIERPRDIPKAIGFDAPGSLSLAKIAEISGASFEELKLLNPHLTQGRTPVGSAYKIWVPEQELSKVESAKPRYLAALEKTPVFERHERYTNQIVQVKKGNMAQTSKVARAKVRIQEPARTRIIRYKVKSGDNLNDLSKRFGVPVGLIKKKNQIKRNKLFRGEVLKIEIPH